jgi:2-oxoglutarate dehydrogenase E1 component
MDLKHYGFDENTDYEKEFSLGPGILPLFLTKDREKMKLREIIDACKRIYCKQPFSSLPLPRSRQHLNESC